MKGLFKNNKERMPGEARECHDGKEVGEKGEDP